MRTVKLHVLCEGQTELRFASKVLTTYWIEKGIIVLPQLLITSRKKNARGGILSYQQAKRDFRRLAPEVEVSSFTEDGNDIGLYYGSIIFRYLRSLGRLTFDKLRF